MGGGVLSIGELARRAGVSESTLRAWERRYGLLEPERTAGGHRRYRLEDLERIAQLLELVDDGLAVGTAAAHVRAGDAPAIATASARNRAAPARPSADPTPDVDSVALTLAYRAALRLLQLRHAEEATAVLTDLVTALGGRPVSAADAGEDTLPLDLSFGYGEPVLVAAAPLSLARMRLEFVLPELLEGARHVVDLLRDQGSA